MAWCGWVKRNPSRGRAEFYLPRDRAFLLFAQHAHAVTERREIGVAAHIDGVLRAGLYAGVALPAEIRLDIVGAAVGGIDVHDVRRADVDAVPAPVATGHVNESWHVCPYVWTWKSIMPRQLACAAKYLGPVF